MALIANNKRCNQQNKLMHTTLREAQKVADEMGRADSTGWSRVFPYQCPHCKQWHVGHWSKKKRLKR